jgi:hypothetical protein
MLCASYSTKLKKAGKTGPSIAMQNKTFVSSLCWCMPHGDTFCCKKHMLPKNMCIVMLIAEVKRVPACVGLPLAGLLL